MTEKEFTDRTGIKVSPDTFHYIHGLYMATSMEKDEFCADFKQHEGSEIIRDLYGKVVKLEQQRKEAAAKCQNFIDNIVDYLLEKSCDYDSIEFHNKAVDISGQGKVIKRKLALGLPLRKEDIEYINQNLE